MSTSGLPSNRSPIAPTTSTMILAAPSATRVKGLLCRGVEDDKPAHDLVHRLGRAFHFMVDTAADAMPIVGGHKPSASSASAAVGDAVATAVPITHY